MNNRKKRIGIMGGTFDPIHMGHLILGEKAYEQFQLDKVLFMPSGNPPHKRNRQGRATDEQRVEILILSCLWQKCMRMAILTHITRSKC